MGKYTTTDNDIFSIFGKEEWKAESIKTFPSNFIPKDAGSEFIRVNIIKGSPGVNRESVSGVLIIELYTLAGGGPRGASLIADKLDEFLQGQTINKHTQLAQSTMVPDGVDKDDSSLFKSTYTIPFNYFGVI